jgi:HSPB1-associated protein 1
LPVVWEGQCPHETATISEFCDWLNESPRGALEKYDPSLYSGYVAYKHFETLFTHQSGSSLSDASLARNASDWRRFGVHRAESLPVLWFGGKYAHTPCHYDSYSYNLVAQLYGRKRWLLFPPSQTPNLYPTRVPFEESSVFSGVNVGFPDLRTFPRFTHALANCLEVVLHPGDVLFVPKHWWHYVESLESSVSINQWVKVAH